MDTYRAYILICSTDERRIHYVIHHKLDIRLEKVYDIAIYKANQYIDSVL